MVREIGHRGVRRSIVIIGRPLSSSIIISETGRRGCHAIPVGHVSFPIAAAHRGKKMFLVIDVNFALPDRSRVTVRRGWSLFLTYTR